MASRKITLTFLDIGTARTTGWPLRYLAKQLGLWADRTDIEIENLLRNGLDLSKFRMSPVWQNGLKTQRVFQTGYTIAEQLDEAMEALAGDGNDNVEIDFYQLADKVKFRLDEQNDQDFWLTITHNLQTKWLDTIDDKNFYTQHLAGFNYADQQWLPILPSAQGKLFKERFDTNMVVPKTPVS